MMRCRVASHKENTLIVLIFIIKLIHMILAVCWFAAFFFHIIIFLQDCALGHCE